MTQGIFIHGSRPKSKKQIKEYVEGVNNHGRICICVATGPNESQRITEPTCFWHGDDVPPGGRPDNDPYGLVIEATSTFGDEFDGSLAEAERRMNLHREQGKALLEGKLPAPDHDNQALDPRRAKFTFVGPDPYTSRKFYGTIEYNITKGRWTVK